MPTEPSYDLFLLVHPERWPSNDWYAVLGDLADDADAPVALPEDFDAAYGAQVLAAAKSARHAAVILDPADVDSLVEDADIAELIDGEPLDDIDASDLLRIAKEPGGDVLHVTHAAPLRAFHTAVSADPMGLHIAAGTFLPPRPGATALLGGFHRTDCVARVAEKLTGLGWQVSLCPLTTLPLGAGAAWNYPSA